MRVRVLALTALVMICVLRLQASSQPNDPRIIINGGHSLTGPSTSVGLDFSFMADGSGGGIFSFTNDSGEDWTFLEIEAPSPPPPDVITCGGTSFATCVVLPQGDFAIIDFSGGAGILNGQIFTIDLGASGWPPNGLFQARANPAPEPGTLALSLIGLAPVLARRLRAIPK